MKSTMQKMLFFSIIIFISSSCGNTTERILKTSALLVNSTAPKMLDDITRIDKADVISGNTIQYYYTIITANKDSIPIDSLPTDIMKMKLVNSVKSNKQLQELRERDVTFNYIYNDKSGRHLITFSIKPEDYKK